MDLIHWKVFKSVDPTFLTNVKLAFTVGFVGEGGDAMEPKTGLLVMQNGDVLATGKNVKGCLGLPGVDETVVPTKIEALSGADIKSFSAGIAHVIALTTLGKVYTWGSNEFGQLGRGELNARCISEPKLLTSEDPELKNITSIACGTYHSLVLTNKGNVYGWGCNEHGRVGVIPSGSDRYHKGDTTHVISTPKKVHFPGKCTTIIAIACGRDFSAAINEKGKVFCWGNNEHGQLGITVIDRSDGLGPQKIQCTKHFKQIACGTHHCVALTRKNNRMYFWGRTRYSAMSLPVRLAINDVEGISEIAATHLLSLSAFRAQGGVYVWGQINHDPNYFSLGMHAETLQYDYIPLPQRTNIPTTDLVFAICPARPVMWRVLTFFEQDRNYSKFGYIKENDTSGGQPCASTGHASPLDEGLDLIPHGELKLTTGPLESIGQGNAGVVFLGRYNGKNVAIKKLRNEGQNWTKNLQRELKALSAIGVHENVLQFMGASRVPNRLHEALDDVLIVTEYCELLDLKNFLIQRRPWFLHEVENDRDVAGTETSSTEETSRREYIKMRDVHPNLVVTTMDLIRWALQFACGMEYLASKDIIHGDLALRNLLLTSARVLKVADFGLSRKMKGKNYYRIYDGEHIPWATTAPETLRHLKLSIASDVWGFGVTLWEMFTLGDTPFKEFENSSPVPDLANFIAVIENGLRLPQPKYASTSMFKIMESCWELDPTRRPVFRSLIQDLQNL